MFPGATLFFDVGAQVDYWPGGAWALMSPDAATNVVRLFAAATQLGVRQAGTFCAHPAAEDEADRTRAPAAPPHCRAGAAGMTRAGGCELRLPIRMWTLDADAAALATLDRAAAEYVLSGCGIAPDASAASARVIDHVTAGIRDAVVFGAALEHGVAHAVDALLRRRVRTHVVLDASAAADEEVAQRVIGGWKRRLVDVTTTAIVERVLRQRV